MRTRAQARAEARAEAAVAIAECVERHDLLTLIFSHVGEHQGGSALTRCDRSFALRWAIQDTVQYV